eukprot:gene10287-biopygen4644
MQCTTELIREFDDGISYTHQWSVAVATRVDCASREWFASTCHTEQESHDGCGNCIHREPALRWGGGVFTHAVKAAAFVYVRSRMVHPLCIRWVELRRATDEVQRVALYDGLRAE